MKPTFRIALCSLALALFPVQATENEHEIRLGDVFNILFGAYNGAADVAEQRGHPFAERLSTEDAQRLERGLNHLQEELRGLVRTDGTLDSKRAAELLNELQQLRSDGKRFDFVQAEEVLRRADSEGNLGFDSVLVDLLKLVYADRELDSVDAAREEKAHQLLADVLAKGQVSEARYEEIRRLLDAIGRPFRDDYKAWERGRDKIVRRELKMREMNDVIGVLQNKDLTPEQREQILRALQPDKK